MKAGKTIGSGGFGCVFRPALKCKGVNERESNKISKVMTSNNALDEYNQIMLLKDILEKIPNYSNYFIIDGLTICHPDKLTSSDLINFEKCSALPKDDITANNINDSLDKILLLNVPDGGEDLGNYIYKFSTYKEFIQINKSLVQLLLRAILPMNKLNVYHSDIKDSNILVSRKNGNIYSKLIDWGLTVIYDPTKNKGYPHYWKNRPFQYNVPFSSILFSDLFSTKYSMFLLFNKITRETLTPFVINYINDWNVFRGLGHFTFITHIFFIFFEKNHPLERKNITFFEQTYTIPYITHYIVDILIAFKPPSNFYGFPMKEYLDKVFIKNIDVWGLIISYYPIIEIIYENKSTLHHDVKIFNFIKSLYLNVLYINGDKIINISKLIKEMDKLTNLFKKTTRKSIRKKRQASTTTTKLMKTLKYTKTYI